jgi:hypothetical protein
MTPQPPPGPMTHPEQEREEAIARTIYEAMRAADDDEPWPSYDDNLRSAERHNGCGNAYFNEARKAARAILSTSPPVKEGPRSIAGKMFVEGLSPTQPAGVEAPAWLLELDRAERAVNTEAKAQAFMRSVAPHIRKLPDIALSPPPTVPAALEDTVLAEIAAERRRQIEVEGWTPEHDDEHADGQLRFAAACYAAGVKVYMAQYGTATPCWPWEEHWWKPGDDRRSLVKAAALIIAEIERLDRLPGLIAMKRGGL